MADALCGPSNPLQSFQKHSQVDRTLQQDRLTGPRHSPAQGFRTPDPRAGSLDAEFAAFEAGPANPFQLEHPLPSHGFPTYDLQAARTSWANDFQRLSLSNSPLPSQQFRTEAPLVKSNIGGWHNEFMRQRQGGGSSIAQEKQALRTNYTNGVDWSAQQAYAPMLQNQYQHNGLPGLLQHDDMQQWAHPEFSQEGFEQAFTDAFQEAETRQTEIGRLGSEADLDAISAKAAQEYGSMLHDDGTYTNDHSEDSVPQVGQASPFRIGSDAIEYTEQQDRTADQNTKDADELARTAGQLLNSIQHDTSAKFQGSQFLALMRKIRDREVEVQDEDFKTIPHQHNGGQTVQQVGTTQMDFEGALNKDQHSQPTDLRPHDPNTFQFPDLNHVYNPHTHDIEAESQEFNFDSDQFANSHSGFAFQPQSQMHALHPGGRWYPTEQSPRQSHVQMSGGISAADFDGHDENADLANKYQKAALGPADAQLR